MDKSILEYRKTHKKCKWCKFYECHYKEVGGWPYSWDTCELKDRPIKEIDKVLSKFCKYYKAKEENEENEV